MEAACITENICQPPLPLKVRWIRVIKENNLNSFEPKKQDVVEFTSRPDLLADSINRRVKARRQEDSRSKKPPLYIRDNSGKVYHFGRLIGKGGYSRCYYTSDENGQPFAAKSLFLPLTPSLSTLLRIEREAQIHEQLHHPFIVKFHKIIQEEAGIYLILDYCANGTLSELIAKRGRLGEIEARQLCLPIFDAVHYLHTLSIHHGDLKMSNIFLDRNMSPKVGDFGFAKQFKTSSQTRSNLCGTPAYMAPEILEKPCVFGLPADVWSLGIIVYAVVYGFTAFDAKSVEAVQARIRSYDLRFPTVVPSLSNEVIELIQAMLFRSPAQRITLAKAIRQSWLHRRCSKNKFFSERPRCELASASDGVLSPSQRKKIRITHFYKPSYFKSLMSKRWSLPSKTKSEDPLSDD